MKLSDEQFEFGKDVIKLLSFIVKEGDKFTFGEAHRPKMLQKLYYYGYKLIERLGVLTLIKNRKKSKTLFSLHILKLAIDLNIFPKFKYISNALKHKKQCQKYGDFWEALNPKNKWGGNWASIINNKIVGFYDGPHFERRRK